MASNNENNDFNNEKNRKTAQARFQMNFQFSFPIGPGFWLVQDSDWSEIFLEIDKSDWF